MKKKFTTKQQEEIYDRDKRCLLCERTTMLSRPHHIFNGTHLPVDWEKGDNINGIWNGCILCIDDHNGFHHTAEFNNRKTIAENTLILEQIAQERFNVFKRLKIKK